MALAPLTYPDLATFGALVIQLGNGANPEVFSKPCGFTSKSFNRGSSTSTASVPPCNNEDGASQTVTAITAKTKQLQGSGVFAREDALDYSNWHESGLPRNIRVIVAGLEYFTGPAVLSSYNVSVAKDQNGNLMQASITIDQAGEWTQTTGVPAS